MNNNKSKIIIGISLQTAEKTRTGEIEGTISRIWIFIVVEIRIGDLDN